PRLSSFTSAAGIGGLLTDAEDHELGGTQRRHAHEADQPPVVQIVLRHRRPIAADEVRLFGLGAEQPAVAELVEQEVFDRTADVRPQLRAVVLEHRPLRPDRKSIRLNSSHVKISYAVFCLKKKNY